MNPLLAAFNTPFGTPPFSKIANKHFKPAIEKAIEIAKKEVADIVNNPQPASFENTLVALDFSGQALNRVTQVFFNLNAAETSDEIQQIAKEIAPLLSKFSNDIALNEELFQRIKTVYDVKDTLNLTTEQNTLLENNYKSFVRNGANLNTSDKNKLREIDTQLAETALNFGEKVLAATHHYELHITNKNDLKGLPQGSIEAAKMAAEQKNKQGWIFTLDFPSYNPFVSYADNRKLREQIVKANGNKTFKNDEFDNQQNVLKIVKLRYQRANLLGYKSHAHFVLENQMATNTSTVNTFLNDLLIKAKPVAIEEYNTLCQFAKDIDGIELLASWDIAYYKEKLKQKLFNLDDEQLKP